MGWLLGGWTPGARPPTQNSQREATGQLSATRTTQALLTPRPKPNFLRERRLKFYYDQFHQHAPPTKEPRPWKPNLELLHPKTNAIVHAPKSDYVMRPAPCMTEDFRRGRFFGFFKHAEIIKAEDFNYAVDLDTGRIAYSNRWEDGRLYLQTDHLEDEDEDDRIKVKRRDQTCNLYYVTLLGDEAPSYHFWRRPGDIDPIKPSKPSKPSDEGARKRYEPTGLFKPEKSSPEEGTPKEHSPVDETSNSASNSDSSSSSATADWSIAASELAANPFQADLSVATTFERQRRKYENRIHRDGLKTVLNEVAEVAPREIAHLRSGLRIVTVPSSDEGESREEILREPTKTVAHKLTQIMMNAIPPPSPLHGNELAVRQGFVPYKDQSWKNALELAEADLNRKRRSKKGKGKTRDESDDCDDSDDPDESDEPDDSNGSNNPDGSQNDGSEDDDPDDDDNDDPLMFLDYYNDKSYGNPIIRSKPDRLYF